jgi:RND superfamily putative drug exporter
MPHAPSNSTAFERVVVDRPIVPLLLWMLLVLAALPFAAAVKDRLVVAGVIHTGQAAAVDRILSEEFESRTRNLLILVVTGMGSVDWSSTQDAEHLKGGIEAFEFVMGASWFTPVKRSSSTMDRHPGSYLIVGIDPLTDPMNVLRPLRAETTRLQGSMENSPPGLTLRWTGNSAVRESIITSSNKDLRNSELRALPLVFLLLLFAFRSLVAALIPLFFGAFAVIFTLAAVSLIAEFMTLSIMVQTVASLLGLALGIDYALLMINRFREAMTADADVYSATLTALRNGGRTIVISGSAVAIGFLGLMLVPVDQLRSIACAGVLVAGFSVLLATTLMPAILVILGPRLEWGRIPWFSKQPRSERRWRRWAQFVCRRPVLVLLFSGIPLILLVASSRQLSSSFPEETWLPPKTEAVIALRTLERIDAGNIVRRLNIVYQFSEDVSVLDPRGYRALTRLHRHLMKDEHSERVRSLVTFAGSNITRRAWMGRVPDEMRDHFVSRDGSSALLEFIPYSTLDQNDLAAVVQELRDTDFEEITGLPGKVLIGGLPAAAVDYESVIRQWFPHVIALVALGSFIVLALAFRSLLIPLKAVLLNLMAVFAAYGALLLVFVHGYGAEIFGLSEPVTAVFPATTVIVFCAAFGISMDYEVFLISRVAEARRKFQDETTPIVEALTKTGSLITSAAAIMVTVFGAFAFGNILPTKILGFALAAVVALDAVLVRMALGPASIKLAGRFNWWPGSRN